MKKKRKQLFFDLLDDLIAVIGKASGFDGGHKMIAETRKGVTL